MFVDPVRISCAKGVNATRTLAGYCSSCGTLTYVCKECEKVLALESGANRCWGCNAQYDVAYGSGGKPTDIVQIGPPDE